MGISSVAVIGLGYIGLPTAAILASQDVSVLGVDVNQRTVDAVNRGDVPFVEPDLATYVAGAVTQGKLSAALTPSPADAFIVAVPTPFTDGMKPDLSYIQAAAQAIAPQLQGGELLILESTSPPGATQRMADWILEARPDLSLDGSEDRPVIHVAHCPERVLPGRVMIELVTNDRIVGGLTDEAAERARDLYQLFCQGEIHLTNAVTAEMAKLVENSFRDVNIAFANEVSIISDKLGIDAWELIRLANRHPRVDILQPGPGVGGHCIAVDPWFIVDVAPQEARLIRTAREVNDAKPAWVVEKVRAALLDVEAPKIAALGIAFKPDIDDIRESPAVDIIVELADTVPKAELLVVDPHVAELPGAMHSRGNISLVELDEALSVADAVLLLVDHAAFRAAHPFKAARSSAWVLDTRGAWSEKSRNDVQSAGVIDADGKPIDDHQRMPRIVTSHQSGEPIAPGDSSATDHDDRNSPVPEVLAMARGLVGSEQYEAAERAYANMIASGTGTLPSATAEDVSFLVMRKRWRAIRTWVDRSGQEVTDEVGIAYSVALVNDVSPESATSSVLRVGEPASRDLTYLLFLHAKLADGTPQKFDLDGSGLGVSPQVLQLGASLVAVHLTGDRQQLERLVELSEGLAGCSRAVRRVAATLTGWAWLLSDPFREDGGIAARMPALLSGRASPGDEAAIVWHGVQAALDSYTGAAAVRLLCGESPHVERGVDTSPDADVAQPLLIRSLGRAFAVRTSLGQSTVEDPADDLQTLLDATLKASGRETPASALLRITRVLALLRFGATSSAMSELQAMERQCDKLGALEWLSSGLLVSRAILEILSGRCSRPEQAALESMADIAQNCGYWAIQAGRVVAGDPTSDSGGAINDYHPAMVARAISRVTRPGVAAREFVDEVGVLSDRLLSAGYKNYQTIAALRVSQAEVLVRLGRTKHALRVCEYVSKALADPTRLPQDTATRLQVAHARALLVGERYLEAQEVLEPEGKEKELTPELPFLRGVAAFGAGDRTRARLEFQAILSSPTDDGEDELWRRKRALATRWLDRLSVPKIHENGVR